MNTFRKINVFRGPDDPAGAGGANPNPASANPAPAPAPAPTPRSFSQEELNSLLARERKGIQDKLVATTQQLEQLRDAANTTQEQRDQLQQQIDDLQAQFQTKEQQASEAYKKLENKYKKETTEYQESANRWRSRFETQLVSADISRFAAAADAFDVEQISAILLPKTKVVEQLEDGKPTGNFTSLVDFVAKGSDGKPIAMKLSIEDAIKAMKDWPEKYGNLFKAKANGGLGGDTSSGGQQQVSLKPLDASLSMEDYIKMRKDLGVEEAAR